MPYIGEINIHEQAISKTTLEWLDDSNVYGIGRTLIDTTLFIIKIGDGINTFENLNPFHYEKTN